MVGRTGVQAQRILSFQFVLAICLIGCGVFRTGISYYDPTTYRNLTDLKPEVVMLYESFGSDPVDTAWIRAVRLKLAQLYEYEKGKGAANNKPPAQETLYDQPHADNKRTRVTGPFTVEAVPAPVVKGLSDLSFPNASIGNPEPRTALDSRLQHAGMTMGVRTPPLLAGHQDRALS